MVAQRTLFNLTQDGLVVGKKLQRIYPEFDVSASESRLKQQLLFGFVAQTVSLRVRSRNLNEE